MSAEREGLLNNNGSGVKPLYVVPGRNNSINKSGADIPQISKSSPAPQRGSIFSSLFGKKSGGSILTSSSRPVKAEPKVFFANERTFLAWLNMSVTLSSIAVALLAFSEHNEYSQVYGFLIMPIAIGFSVYALVTYVKRANMLRHRKPYGYEDRRGPTIIAVLLALSLLVNMALKIVDIYQSPEPKSMPSNISPAVNHIAPAVEPAPSPSPAPEAPSIHGKGDSSSSSKKSPPPAPEPKKMKSGKTKKGKPKI